MNADEGAVRRRSDRLTNDARILQAAGRLLAEDANASISAVAEAAGVARLTVYRRYPDRRALIDALHEAVESELMNALASFPGWVGGPSALSVLVAILTATAHRYPVVLRDHRVDSESPVDLLLIEIFAAGQRAGTLRSDVAADLINGYLFAMIRAQHQLRGDADSRQAAVAVADLLLRGVGARGTAN